MKNLITAIILMLSLMSCQYSDNSSSDKNKKDENVNESKPENNSLIEAPEITLVPEITPIPEITPVPEVTPVPEITPIPEITPVPEVTPVPEITPTPIPEITPIPEVTPVPEVTPIPEVISCLNSSIFYGGNGTDEDPYLICNKTQFNNISIYPTASFELINDIDLESKELKITNFSGTLDGKLFSIKNLYNQINTSFFENTNNATIKNIIFDNFNVSTVSDQSSVFANVNYSYFENIIFKNSNLSGKKNVGFVSLDNNSIFKNIILQSSTINGTENVGGLIAESNNSNIENIINKSTVSGTYKTGGIIGSVKGFLIEDNLLNQGLVSGRDSTGGIFGIIEESIEIKNIHNEGIIYAPEGFSVGGIIGESNISKLSRSSNKGYVFGYIDVGGLVGVILYNDYLKLNINNVFNTGTVTSDGGYVGGIFGNLDASSFYSEFSFSYIYSFGNIISDSDQKGLFFGSIFGDLPSGYSCEELIFSSDITNINNPIGPDDEGFVCPYFNDKDIYEIIDPNTYSSWDISTSDDDLSKIWIIKENKYPEFN